MIRKTIVWSTLTLALVFVILSLAILFAGGTIGAPAMPYVKWTAIGSLAASIVLAVALLAMPLLE